MISIVAAIAIVVWGLVLVAYVGTRRTTSSLLVVTLGGILFLPQFRIDLPGTILSKENLLCLGFGLGCLLIPDFYRSKYKFHWTDILIAGLMIGGAASSISNSIGLHDALVVFVNTGIVWGIPWYGGKRLFSTELKQLEIARLVPMAGLVYVPFCLFEMKMAPMLHRIVYGYAGRSGAGLSVDSMRFGLWRPSVFMKFGLELALFMGICSILAWWYWLHKRQASYFWIATVLTVTLLFSVSTSATALTMAAIGLVFLNRRRVKVLPHALLIALTMVYPAYRMLNIGAVQVSVGEGGGILSERIASVKTRVVSEDFYLKKWSESPLLGSTAWNYWKVGKGNAVPDSFWIIILGKFGLVGWCSAALVLAAPMSSVLWRTISLKFPTKISYVLALCVLVYSLDCLLNDMGGMFYVLVAGS
ncbi:MAG: hypothetical protein JNL58_32220, partial [Planctomyces sp.]|nr:hypothetical protein [Planctomyces sp.]